MGVGGWTESGHGLKDPAAGRGEHCGEGRALCGGAPVGRRGAAPQTGCRAQEGCRGVPSNKKRRDPDFSGAGISGAVRDAWSSFLLHEDFPMSKLAGTGGGQDLHSLLMRPS